MANPIVPYFDLTRAEEMSLAVCIDLAADLYSRNPHYVLYHQKFTGYLNNLEKLYREEMFVFGAAPVDVIEIQSNYDYARIIRNGLSLLRQVQSLSPKKAKDFIYTIKNLLDNANIIVEITYKKHPIAHEYFSMQYDNIHRFYNDIAYYVKVSDQNQRREEGGD